MKILRYLIFLSILSGICFGIYRQSDEKSFRRWWISLKIVVLIAASITGLVSESAEAKRVRVKFKLTKQEQDAFDYFNGQNFYKYYQSLETPPHIYI